MDSRREDSLNGLPKWPDAAGELPGAEPPDSPGYDGWLIAAGLAYPVLGLGLLLLGGRMGPASLGPEVIILPAICMMAAAIGARLDGAQLRWSTIAAFVGWVTVVAFGQLWLWAAAVSSV